MMKTGFLLGLAVLLLPLGVSAQTSTTRIPFVQAQGTGTVTIQPDQAILDLSVVTQANTATATSAQNATAVTSVLSALTSLLGAGASIKTVSYSLNANYSYSSGGQATLIGYTATNTVEATITDLTMIGQTIDAGIQAGANQIAGLTFGLKNDSSARASALTLATQQASAAATAMASGVGMHTGAVQIISEGSTIVPVPVSVAGTAAPTTTPIVSGTLSVQATVTLQVALTQ
jgi:uncharacterized protein YggE